MLTGPTVGIIEKPELAPLDQLAKQFSFEPPRKKGLNTIEALESIVKGDVRAVFNLGGNLVRSVPDRLQTEPAWARLRLTINVATKLNRSHLVHGDVSYILPCLSRIERHQTPLGDQAVSMEDSTGCMHGSRGATEPASDKARPEPYIVAGIAKATLADHAAVDWDAWRNDYSLVRDEIAKTYPETFHDFNKRMWEPGGFHRPLPARQRQWKTKTGKAEFVTPQALGEDPDMPEKFPEALRLMALRSDSQFNTTIYNIEDRFRGVKGSRMVILMNKADIEKRQLREGQKVTLQTIADDGIDRRLEGLAIKAYEISGRVYRRILPRMQCTVAPLALREGKQGTGSEVNSSANHLRSPNAVDVWARRRRLRPKCY